MTGRALPVATSSVPPRSPRALLVAAVLLVVVPMAAAQSGSPQTSPQAGAYERTYRQSKSAVEKALKELQPSMSGRLPVLEGFALPGEHPLSHYQRAYYQSAVQVSPTASGGTVVRVTAKVTAWYTDSTPSRSGYQLLTSNGRLESDLLDQLTEDLASTPRAMNAEGNSSESFPVTRAPSASKRPDMADHGTAEPIISAPMPQSPGAGHPFSSSVAQGLSGRQPEDSKNSTPSDRPQTALQGEAASLEEVLKNQAHPKNLVAIKKTGTPVEATPSLNAKTLFLASAHDEFEMLDYNADWVHVRISGLSRGWIWRTSLEMPEGISDVPPSSPSAAPVAADLFQVTREETAPFPGDWEPLRGRNVKIISVQKVQENEKDSGAQAKLEFAKSLLDKNYPELEEKSKELAGVVLIFDSVDGGMIAATLPTVQHWKAGTLSDAALWHQCYFDPPETFNVSSPGGGH
ncbi:MAG TPA: hypothetical protein VJX69_10130 [Terriglobales bacterium]|nr:hypothetical protein [Terriglobales bacterium]